LYSILKENDFPNADVSISETSVKFFSVGAECKGSTSVDSLGDLTIDGNIDGLVDSGERLFGLKVVTHGPDSDFIFSCNGNPRKEWVEGNLIDGGSSFILIFGLLEISDVPNIDLLVFTSGGDEVTVERRNSNSIDVVFMGFEGEPGSVVQVPDLKPSVPTNSDEVRCDTDTLSLGRESNHTNPIDVVVLIGGVLALSLGVEELDLLISTWGEDLPVIGRKGNSEDFFLVTNESVDALSGLEVPKTEIVIPWSRNQETVVVGEGEVTDEVGVTLEGLLGLSSKAFSGCLREFLPNDGGLIAGTRYHNISVVVILAGDDAGNPVSMSLEVTEMFEIEVPELIQAQ
jgi:hypothetical protein